MKITSITISNILSIENASINFEDSGLILFQGWNQDTNSCNGAGKTAIFNAITFALYDKMPRKITASEILRRGTKSGYVELAFESRGKQIVIKRLRPKGFIYKEDGIVKTKTQDEFEKLIGLNYNQYISTMYCPQGGNSRFLALNDTDKKQFMLQLMDLEVFSSCKKVADTKISELTINLNALKSKEDSLLSKIDAYSDSLIDQRSEEHTSEL